VQDVVELSSTPFFYAETDIRVPNGALERLSGEAKRVGPLLSRNALSFPLENRSLSSLRPCTSRSGSRAPGPHICSQP
jgi:hypothetical protein